MPTKRKKIHGASSATSTMELPESRRFLFEFFIATPSASNTVHIHSSHPPLRVRRLGLRRGLLALVFILQPLLENRLAEAQFQTALAVGQLYHIRDPRPHAQILGLRTSALHRQQQLQPDRF